LLLKNLLADEVMLTFSFISEHYLPLQERQRIVFGQVHTSLGVHGPIPIVDYIDLQLLPLLDEFLNSFSLDFFQISFLGV
tara:strand:- start:1068 stop:1307 length:240 start_codon:yes stop_codon:yes gene_type:complete